MILIIDRDPDVCQSVKEVLEYEGYKVDCARSMEIARPLLYKNIYSVILVDRILLNGNDYSFVGQGRVVVMTSCLKDQLKFTHTLSRPFSLSSLLKTVYRL